MKATIEWFRIYKIPDGKPENQFAFNGEPKPADFALKIIEEVHQYWKKLISRESDGKDISLFVFHLFYLFIVAVNYGIMKLNIFIILFQFPFYFN